MSDQEESTLSEQAPLLRPTRPAGPSRTVSFIPQVHSPHFVLFLIFCALFMLMSGSFLLVAPQLRVYEDIICRHYYDETQGEGHIALTQDIDERFCKIDEIQEELAIVVGGLSVTDSIPSILFALPYGVLGDRIGRKPVFGLALFGIILSQSWILLVCWFWRTFPLRWIWFNSFFQIIGGGSAIAQSTLYVLISDVSTEANRANYFFWVGCGMMVAELIFPSVASSLMLRSPWIPIFLGTGMLILGGLFMIFVPETLHQKPVNGSLEPVEELSGSSSGSSTTSVPPMKQSLLSKFNKNFTSTFDTLRVYASPILFVLLATFLIQLFNRQLIDQVMRYISKRFSWTLAQTGFLLSLRGLINIVLFLAILPGVSYILTSSSTTAYSIPGFRFNLSTAAKDLVLARFSLVVQITGTIMLGLSAFSPPMGESTQENVLPLILTIGGIIIYTLGMGFSAFCRSLASTLVDKEHVARLYAVLAITDVIGASITGPALAGLYSWGLKLSRNGERKEYLGLPFWGAMAITALAGGGVMFVKAPERKDEGVEEDPIRTAESNLQTEMLI